MMPAIAIVGMSCQYPDARSPVELWENMLSQRRAFRRIPPERLNLADYLSPDPTVPDRTYSAEAALIEGYEFDRVRFRVVGSTYRSADLVHWLALDIAAQALADAGFAEGEGLPRQTTGVLVGNTLTGEFSRASVIRLRWPYVRRMTEAALIEASWSPGQRRIFLERLEARYKAPFAPIGEETLAGSLSNTIAGRICNYFDLKGGGYTVDGACASSLLAISHACSALLTGDLDVAIAGGVDLSLDPFELVGFAKTGALAPELMRVYDTRAAGFWPGEGCGLVVLMRYEEAKAQNRRIYAIIRGWGVSSDGSGGITRPDVEGQSLALQRAYGRAGFGIETVPYFEGHGTGTSMGDATELRVLSLARRKATGQAPPAAIGSVKAIIGHTKAAAGVAGLIKASQALYTQILPPTTGCEEPHTELTGEAPALRVLSAGEVWPLDQPLRAGVSAMGFGGINTHLVLEGVATERRTTLNLRDRILLASAQDAELFMLSAPEAAILQQQLKHLLTLAPRLSWAELSDLAAHLEETLNIHQVRAAVVASSPAELATGLKTVTEWLADGTTTRLDIGAGVYLGTGITAPHIGFLFPGQGSPAYLNGGALRRRFQFVQELYLKRDYPQNGRSLATAVAQPAIVTASLAALRVLDQLGVKASVAIGHSLGELTAFHWAGVLDEAALLRIVTARGKTMGELPTPTGAMASIGAGWPEVETLLTGQAVVIACLNSPSQTVISGEATAVATVTELVRAKGLRAVDLPVSHAFHSPLVAAAMPPLAACLAGEDFQPLQRPVISTVTGASLRPDEDLRALLCRQVTSPVRFMEAVTAAVERVNLLIEVGPGRVLSGLVNEFVNIPMISLDAGGPSLKGLLQAVAAAFVLGAPVNHAALFTDRFTRPFDLKWQPRFFVNPCELAPLSDILGQPDIPLTPAPAQAMTVSTIPAQLAAENRAQVEDLLILIRQLVAERVELPLNAVRNEDRLLSDLHLNSITVGQLVVEAARYLNLPPPLALTDYADATVTEVARALAELAPAHKATLVEANRYPPSGVDSWIRAFTVALVERPLPHRQTPSGSGAWQVIASPNHPLAGRLRQAFAHSGGSGIVVCLPQEPDEDDIGLLLKGAWAVLAEKESTRFVLVQHGGGGAAFARTLHLEASQVTTCVVDVPLDHPQAVEWVLAEALAAVGYSEAHYDSCGRRQEPNLRLLSTELEAVELPLGPDDVLLVTGGGKGITAECALSLARQTGVRLALLGRSQPAADAELAANLERMTAMGVHFRYIVADVTDTAAVQAAVRQVVAELGPITGILHGAARNVPQLLNSLNEATFRRTLATKVEGIRNLLAAVDPNQLRLLVGFGSIIARTGLPGEADYGVANEWLTLLIEQFQAEHPACRCLVVEWSIWSGAGMGARLGGIDRLVQRGISPISPDQGVSSLHRLLSQQLPAIAVVVTGRFGELPTLKVEQPDLPFLRFLERPRIYYPGVELVVEAELSTETDPYLNDHVFRGERLFPAVMGLEAMAQVATALVGATEPPIFENVQFNRPIVVAEATSVTIRIAALVREPGRVEVVLRSAETAFQVDHFRAMCQFGRWDLPPASQSMVPPGLEPAGAEFPLVGLKPKEDLYGGLLFQGGRFQRLRGYWQLAATGCIAETISMDTTSWFGSYLPPELTLGDPGARDATLHAIQACVPHAALLPIGVERLVPGVTARPGPALVRARERGRKEDIFIYDVEVASPDGEVGERWEGLRLRMVSGTAFRGQWVEPLLGPYIERRVQELIPGSAVAVVVERDADANRRVRSDRAIQRVLGQAVPVRRRPDGKPEVEGDRVVSTAHAADLTLAVAGPGPIGCDVEPVVARLASLWQDLLGPERFMLTEVIAQEAAEDRDTAATRVWAASECLKKAGAMVNAPLVLDSSTSDGWVTLTAGPLVSATYIAPIRGVENRLVLAVLVEKSHASL